MNIFCIVMAKNYFPLIKMDRAKIRSGTEPDRCKQKITNHCRRIKAILQVQK